MSAVQHQSMNKQGRQARRNRVKAKQRSIIKLGGVHWRSSFLLRALLFAAMCCRCRLLGGPCPRAACCRQLCCRCCHRLGAAVDSAWVPRHQLRNLEQQRSSGGYVWIGGAAVVILQLDSHPPRHQPVARIALHLSFCLQLQPVDDALVYLYTVWRLTRQLLGYSTPLCYSLTVVYVVRVKYDALVVVKAHGGVAQPHCASAQRSVACSPGGFVAARE